LRRDERTQLQQAVAALDRWHTQSALTDIAVTRSGHPEAARTEHAAAMGKELFDDFRTKAATFLTTVEQRTSRERDALARNSTLAIIALLIASAVGIVAGSLMRRWVRRSIELEEHHLREQLSIAEVHRLASSLAQARTPHEVGEIGTRDAARVLGADAVHLWTEGDRDRLTLVGSTDGLATSGSAPSVLSSLDRNGPADALRTGNARYFPTRDAFAAEYPGWVSVVDVQGAQSVAIVPATSPHGPVGSVEVFYQSPRAFDELERTILALIADQIGSALDRARTRDREYAATARLQDSLLGPRHLVDGAGHSTRYLPAETSLNVGGDWHNAQRLPDGRILVAVGDVVGRGLEAATVMGQLRSAVSACAPRCATPGDLLDALDDFAAEIPGASSSTIALAFVDVDNATLTYVCAGHPPPILVSPTGMVRVLDDAVTWPLAIAANRPAHLGVEVPFPPGSMVILYSDGLIERRGEILDEGIRRIERSVAENWNLPLDILCDRIVERGLRGQRRNDDVALLALRSPAANPRVFLMQPVARPDAVGRVRERLREWLDGRGLAPDDQLAILVAVGEACTNAIEHAYGNEGRNLFRVEACCRNGYVLCCVTDSGAWKDNAMRTARGNGVTIMNELMDDVTIERRPNGTAVTLTYRLGTRDAAALQR
jgi:serine phosphatase RsbU (regulator of sigma subunit)/anti-sigma regulatory factor (Ser/Thr protein kinase)